MKTLKMTQYTGNQKHSGRHTPILFTSKYTLVLRKFNYKFKGCGEKLMRIDPIEIKDLLKGI